MSRSPASVTQADVARIIRAAKQAGAASVTVKIRDTEVVIGLDYGKPTEEKIVRL